MRVKRSTMLAVSLLATLAATGCKREAGGQVVAVVNGDEITAQELNAEMAGFNVPKGTDVKIIQRQVLQRIIDRRLLAAAARKDGLDKEQDYLLRQKQADDTLLGQLLAKRSERTFRIPDAGEIDKFVATHPTLFAQRAIYQFDQIQFPVPADMQSLGKLKDAHSMDAAAAVLTSLGINYTRNNSEIDSAAIPPLLLERIKKLPPGEPFLLPQPGALIVAVVIGSKAAPTAPEQARPVAVRLMRQENLEKALQQRLKTDRSAAKIEYQPGFAPQAPAKS